MAALLQGQTRKSSAAVRAENKQGSDFREEDWEEEETGQDSDDEEATESLERTVATQEKTAATQERTSTQKGVSAKMTVTPRCSDAPTFQLFKEQEKENGNVMSVEKEVSKVNRYCKWWVFRMVKWPTEEMLEFSEETDEMTLEEKSQERGLICRQVIKKFGSGLDDKEGWWRMVNGEILLTMGKRRACMAEVIKKTHQGEFDMAWRVAQLESE